MNRVRDLGCVACRLNEPDTEDVAPAQNHHLTDCGRRRGHAFTIGLCAWHHQGYPILGWSAAQTRAYLGPSFKEDAAGFMTEYGTDAALLTFQEWLLKREDASDHGGPCPAGPGVPAGSGRLLRIFPQQGAGPGPAARAAR